MSSINKIPCMIIRGGTSKGIYILEKDLPHCKDERNKILLKLMGSPDTSQIDGLGGATSVTSKVAIISLSGKNNIDIDYTFAQVSITESVVDYQGNCGNISSGVGLFAIEKGLIKPSYDTTVIKIFNTNTNKVIIEYIQTPNGIFENEGNYSIDGVPGTSSPIKLVFEKPAGSVFGKLFPTGSKSDILTVPDFGEINVSILDVTNPVVFVDAKSIGMTGIEMPCDIEEDIHLSTLIENIRSISAVKLGLIEDYKQSVKFSPAIPKIAIVGKSQSYKSLKGIEISKDEIHIVARMMSMQRPHKTYALTGAMCTAAAAVIPGSIVNKMITSKETLNTVCIGHPNGKITAGVDFDILKDGSIEIYSTYGYRTARLLMKGTSYY